MANLKTLPFLLILLVACISVRPEQPQQVQEVPVVQPPQPVPEPLPITTYDQKLPTRTVKQTGLATIEYGLTEDNQPVHVKKTGATWNYNYQNGKLAEIKGLKNIEFLYNQNRISAIDLGSTKLTFNYDSRGRLVEVKGGHETLHFDYDSLDQIRGVRRGVAGKTSLDYDKQGKLKYITRGLKTTNVHFDDKKRLRQFDGDETQFIMGYWRDNKLISLTGNTFGQGLGISYGPDYPPREAQIKYVEDTSTFAAAYETTLYKVVDEYVYCKHVRRFKDLLFEGISYAVYATYFNNNVADYIAMHYKCIPYEE
ncbi:hypothetical protein HY489_01180 [Candidatus Woesearchaeota archaeon]|nr:hypothetical protein [Candidatus Woesearchaeota archaeon]